MEKTEKKLLKDLDKSLEQMKVFVETHEFNKVQFIDVMNLFIHCYFE